MKKLLFWGCCFANMFLVCDIAYSANIYNRKEIICNLDMSFCKTRTDEPITGIVKYRNIEADFADGRPNGITKEYYSNGNLKQEISFKNGIVDGIRKEYYETGPLHIESEWKNDVQNGITKVYYESGALQVETNVENGMKNGIRKEYYESGALKSKGTWQFDRLLEIEKYPENQIQNNN